MGGEGPTQGDGGDEVEPVAEEAGELRKIKAAQEPIRAVRLEHEDENHTVYRSWCAICRNARSTGTQHKRNLEKSAEEETAGPKIFSDFFYMSTKEELLGT